jgi:hypothetical protein
MSLTSHQLGKTLGVARGVSKKRRNEEIILRESKGTHQGRPGPSVDDKPVRWDNRLPKACSSRRSTAIAFTILRKEWAVDK